MTTTDPADDGALPKSTLFCPECGHRSSVDGDWTLVDTARETRYCCPDCETVITTRPAYGDETTGQRSYDFWERAWETWEESVRAYRTFWYRRMLP